MAFNNIVIFFWFSLLSWLKCCNLAWAGSERGVLSVMNGSVLYRHEGRQSIISVYSPHRVKLEVTFYHFLFFPSSRMWAEREVSEVQQGGAVSVRTLESDDCTGHHRYNGHNLSTMASSFVPPHPTQAQQKEKMSSLKTKPECPIVAKDWFFRDFSA